MSEISSCGNTNGCQDFWIWILIAVVVISLFSGDGLCGLGGNHCGR